MVGWYVVAMVFTWPRREKSRERERERDSGAKKAVGVSWIGYVGIFWGDEEDKFYPATNIFYVLVPISA